MTEPSKPNDHNYGAYKVSEYTHQTSSAGKQRSYKVDESEGVPARQATQNETSRKLEQMAEELEA